jgi:transcriptional regulator with XRE-family HTH domain
VAVLTSEDHAKARACGSRLRLARQKAGCATMEEGARRARTVSSVYHRHETGVLMPTVRMIERYAAAFGCSPCWLAFGRTEKPKPKPTRLWRGRRVSL